MTRNRLLGTVLVVAAAIRAQVAPASLTGVNGNASSSWPFDLGLGRYQQIHRQVPGPVTITAIAFRRDFATPPTAAPLWWSEFVVRMGNGRFEQAVPSFAANYLTPAVEVMHRRRVVLPDWSIPTTANPPPFDFVIPLDVPYVHTGQHPLLWEIEVFAQSSFSHWLGAVDAFTDPVFTTSQGTAYGTGCGVQLTGSASATTENQFYVWVGEWPYTQTEPRLFGYGFTDPNLVLPELCAPLRVDPVAVFDAGIGVNHGFYTPYNPAAAGLVLRAQMFRLTSLPLQNTNAVAITLPAMPSHGDRDAVQVTQVFPSSLIGIVRGQGVVVKFR
ncbi:MAG: hypothetical protein WAT39_24285 [Planctomycetota bacterium]